MLLFKQLRRFLVHALLLSLVALQLRGLVDGIPISSSLHDNVIDHQNKTKPMINATTEIDRNNELHESGQLSTVPTTTAYSTETSLHTVPGLNETKTWDDRINTSTTLPVTAKSKQWSTFYIRTTTVSPSMENKHSFNLKILEYVLFPVGAVLLLIVSCCLVRYVQRVRRKRRLERELLHQYSYPNSEADEMENDQNITEIDSIVNSQFVAYNDYNDKAMSDEIPQVTVTIGGATMSTVKQDTEDQLEQSTSFNA